MPGTLIASNKRVVVFKRRGLTVARQYGSGLSPDATGRINGYCRSGNAANILPECSYISIVAKLQGRPAMCYDKGTLLLEVSKAE